MALRLIARAETFDHAKQSWNICERDYRYKGTNRTCAINWALSKIEKEFPNHRCCEVKVIEG
jgi:hypothetical protein